ncbi:MAG: hypothetical protein EXQ87_06535 [Alphaproteobacteria bacterium]|nr:hypothetical protein [Alphaproteobacteria bacterium]
MLNRILWTTLMAALAVALFALSPQPADARAGKGNNVGSGSKSMQSQPAQRSATSPATQQARPAAPAQQPGFFQRNPMLGGIMGGLIGAGIGAMLFGNMGNLFGDGAAGFMGLLLQMALIGGVVYVGLLLWRRRRGAQAEPAYAGPAGYQQPQDMASEPLSQRSALDTAPGGGGFATVVIGPADYDAFTEILTEVQKAWSGGDMTPAAYLLSDEVRDHLAAQLAEDKAAGRRNHVSDVVLVKGDLDRSWREDGLEWATVSMRWRALDYTVDVASGRVVDGNDRMPVEASERWTLSRRSGDSWRLVAIEQV